MKPKIPNQKKRYNSHHKRVESYVYLITQLYYTLNKEVAKIAMRTGYDGNAPFRFSDYPSTKDAIDKLQRRYVNNLQSIVINGITAEWGESNFVQDELVKRVLGSYGAKFSDEKYSKFFSNNDSALKAFIARKDKRGMNLSARVWDMSANYKQGLEQAVSLGISNGTSAVALSKQISQYLNDFPSMRKEYADKFGKASDILDCEYRSARLARTEIGMAYRNAEQERWSQLDFVVGYEVKRSGRGYPCSVCESLAGKYPKSFNWSLWHPNCMCYAIPILKTEDEFWSWDGRSDVNTSSVNEVKDVPNGFKQWISDNQNRINDAKKNGTLSYFLKDNPKFTENNKMNGNYSEIGYNALHSFDEVLKKFNYKEFIERGSITDDGVTAQGYFGEIQGFNKNPTLVDEDMFDILSKDKDNICIYRGYRRNPNQYVNDFKKGKLFEGKGAYGDGSYFATSESTGLSYTDKNNKDHVVYALFNKKNVKIAQYEELEESWLSDRNNFGRSSEYAWNKQAEIMKSGGSNDDRLSFVNSLYVYEDFGSWCTAKGYDFIYIKKEDFYVMLNRTKVVVKK